MARKQHELHQKVQQPIDGLHFAIQSFGLSSVQKLAIPEGIVKITEDFCLKMEYLSAKPVIAGRNPAVIGQLIWKFISTCHENFTLHCRAGDERKWLRGLALRTGLSAGAAAG